MTKTGPPRRRPQEYQSSWTIELYDSIAAGSAANDLQLANANLIELQSDNIVPEYLITPYITLLM